MPIYIRTGKRLPKRVTEVAMQFQGVPHLAFTAAESRDLRPNALVLRIQPDEGVALRFGAKVPGQAFRVRDVLMDMSYGAAFLEEPPDAYERLLLDAMVGDPTLFIRSDEVDQAWQIVAAAAHRLGRPPHPAGRLRGRDLGSPPSRSAHRARRATMANPVEVDCWDAQGVRLTDIVEALADLRHQAISKNAIRTAVMTLVAVMPADEQAYAAIRALRFLGRHHPARIVLLRPDPDQVATLDGRAALFAVEVEGHQVNFEEVTLMVGGQAANHLDSLVETFTLADLPVPVWYVGDVPDPADPLLSVATTVLIDSRDAAGSGQLRALLELARRRTVVDLSWIRLGPWRELLSGLFEPAGPQVAARSSRWRSPGRSAPAACSAGGWPPSSCSPTRFIWSTPGTWKSGCYAGGGRTALFEVGRGEPQRTVAARAELPGPGPRAGPADRAGAGPAGDLAGRRPDPPRTRPGLGAGPVGRHPCSGLDRGAWSLCCGPCRSPRRVGARVA